MMTLGPIQKAWVEGLKANPHLQCKTILGKVDNLGNIIKACCLGFLHYTNTEQSLNGDIIDLNIEDDTFNATGLLHNSYENYGLRSCEGYFVTPVEVNGTSYVSLVNMNDNGLTWPEIAEYVEANPENVFAKSV